MKLPVTLHNRVTDFLNSLPNIDNGDGQRSLVYHAGLDAQLQNLIPFDKPAMQFIQLLVPTLLKYGKLDDKRYALEALLEAAKNYVGQDKREYCETLIEEIKDFFQDVPHCQTNEAYQPIKYPQSFGISRRYKASAIIGIGLILLIIMGVSLDIINLNLTPKQANTQTTQDSKKNEKRDGINVSIEDKTTSFVQDATELKLLISIETPGKKQEIETILNDQTKLSSIKIQIELIAQTKGLKGIVEDDNNPVLEHAPKVGALLLFDYDSAEIKPESRMLLDQFAEAMKSDSLKDSMFVIVGHTDDTGNDEYDLQLSRQRAEAVKSYLVQVHRLSAEHLLIKAYGGRMPIASNETAEGRSKNRRIEFIRIQ